MDISSFLVDVPLSWLGKPSIRRILCSIHLANLIRAGSQAHCADTLRLFERLLRPTSGHHIVGGLIGAQAQEVERHQSILCLCSSVGKKNGYLIGYCQYLAQVLFCFRDDLLKMLPSMTHFLNRHASVVP